MKDYLLERLSEPSTWRGICALVTAAGVAIDPGQVEAIIVAGLAAIGLIGAFTRDNPEPVKKTEATTNAA